MNKTCLILDDRVADYHFGEDHPFGPKRYWAFKEAFERRQKLTNKNDSIELCRHIHPASEQQLALFHTPGYIDKVKQQSKTGKGYLDGGDTPARKGIYEAACIMVGSTLSAIDHIMQGDCIHAFTPIAGLHHARRDSAAGFCVFNDCGVAIEYLREKYGIQRIAYVDIDAHHGDGVFYSFEDDKDLVFIDFHQDGHTIYPGTGFINETGKGDAAGSKLNIPLQPGCTDKIALKLWETAEKFLIKAKPEFILLQCGADSLQGDPITQLGLTSRFHAHVAGRLSEIAKQNCEGRLVAMGGGGYNLENIKAAWNNVLERLSN
jgi:acetoin utilization protein AcuC